MTKKNIIETLLFVFEEPISNDMIREALEIEISDLDINKIIDNLNMEYKKESKGIYIDSIAKGYQIRTLPKFYKYIATIQNNNQQYRLSQAALEILSIIAFKQPISRLDIELIRGVDSIGAIKNLLDKKLIVIKKRRDKKKKSLLYVTSNFFLETFGLNSLEELTNIKDFNEIIEKDAIK